MVINAVRKNDKSGTNKLAATDKENAIIYSVYFILHFNIPSCVYIIIYYIILVFIIIYVNYSK